MKHFRAKKSLVKSGPATFSVARSRFLALAGALALSSAAASGAARAQGASSYDNYFVANGHTYPIAPAGNWVGIKVKPNRSGALLRGLSSEGALDAGRTAQRFPQKHMLLVPVKPGASSAQRSALKARLSASNAVQGPARAYVFNGASEAPLIDTGDIVVRFAGGDSKKVAKILGNYGASVVRQVESYSPNTFVVHVPDDASGVRVANVLASRGDVVFSYPDFAVPTKPMATTNDPLYPNQWHLNNTGQGAGKPGADVRAEQAWDVTRGDPSIIIAVLDNGFDLGHEDFAGKLVQGYDFLDNDPDPSPGGPEDNHGTACAGVAAATGNNGIGVSGIAQGCKIMPIRMLGSFTTSSVIASAFNFATANGADVISNSYGYRVPGIPIFPLIKAAINSSTTVGRGGKGCVIFFASGNDYRSIDPAPGTPVDQDPELPAYEKVIAVGASNNFDRHIDYSNTGKALDLVAPSGGFLDQDGGTLNITTTDRTGPEGYAPGNYTDTFNGTSSATPLAAGVAALLLSVEPSLNYNQVRERLEETADKVGVDTGTYDSAGQSPLFGYGRVNAYRALLGRAPKVTLVTPPDGASLKGIVTVSAITSNDDRVQRMVFSDRRIFFNGSNPMVNKAIPDYNFDGVSDSFVVGDKLPRRFVQTTASVRVRIEHAYVGDLQITLNYTDATGKQVRELIYDHANGGERVLDLNVPLPQALRPVSGTVYTLQVVDDVQEDTGTFVSWGLTLGAPYVTIGTQEKATHTKGTPWQTQWNTDVVTTGTYEVRATAVTDTRSYSDSNGNIKVAGTPEKTFSVSGRVTDTKSMGVAGVLVTNVTAGTTARTDASGNFTLAGLPAGDYVLNVSLQGGSFTPSQRTVTVSSANVTNANFRLSQLDVAAPSLTVTNPIDGAFLRVLTQARGTATDTGGSGLLKVTGVLYRAAQVGSSTAAGYYTKDGTFAPTQSDATERVASGTTQWALTLPTDEGSYRLTVKAYDKVGNIKSTVVSFTIDRTVPIVAISAPKTGAVLKSGFVTASGTTRDAGGVARVTVQLYRAAKGTLAAGYYNPTTKKWTPLATAANEIPAAGTATWSLRLPTLEPTRYTLRATATDKAGNKGTASSTFTVSSPSVPSA